MGIFVVSTFQSSYSKEVIVLKLSVQKMKYLTSKLRSLGSRLWSHSFHFLSSTLLALKLTSHGILHYLQSANLFICSGSMYLQRIYDASQ